MELVSFFLRSYCHNCDSESIVVKDIFGTAITLDEIEKDPSVIDKCRELDHMECTKCGARFMIDWSDENRIPKPMVNNLRLRNFSKLL